MRILKEPVVHFFLLGLAVFGLHMLFEDRPQEAADPYLVEVTSADIEWSRTMWRKQMGREPGVKEMRGRVNQLIREQVLGREARKLGLDRDDPVLRQRLAQKMDYLIRDLSDLREPTDDDLAVFLRENSSEYEIPARLTFTQIFINADDRGETEALQLAEQLIADLSARKTSLAEVSNLGDPILLDPHYTEVTVPDIGISFGDGFAATVSDLPTGSWQGPVRSGFGLHAVYIQTKVEARTPVLTEVKDRLRNDWMYIQQKDLSTRAYQELRRDYRVLVEGMPYELDLEP